MKPPQKREEHRKIRALVVDDHPIVRSGCRRLLEQQASVTVIEADSGEEGYRLYQEQKPEVMLLDITLPGMGGLEVLGRILAYDSKARVIMFSMHEDSVFAARALQAGAKGYLTKSEAPEHLLVAVERVVHGKIYLGHEIAQKLALRNLNNGNSNLLDDLSRRELEILRLLGEGRDLTEISQLLGLSYKTVANNCTQIKNKLGVSKMAELIQLAIRHYLLQG